MTDFIPFDKLSKKEKRKRNSAKRGNWGGINPVTRKPAPIDAYNRNKQKEKDRREQNDYQD